MSLTADINIKGFKCFLFTARLYEKLQIYWDSTYACNMDKSVLQIHILRQPNNQKIRIICDMNC